VRRGRHEYAAPLTAKSQHHRTGSIAGLRAGYSAHSWPAAKAVAIHVTRCVAAELGEKGIRVNKILAPSSCRRRARS
jgi:NAD(P)-dependent dehydrogenase (short-subunit alcohol dehydrogenase family)